MVCASCGRRVDPTRSFCTNCGGSASEAGLQQRRRDDGQIRAGGDAVRARIDALLGRAPASTPSTRSTPPPRSTPAELVRRAQPPAEAPPPPAPGTAPSYVVVLP